MKFTGIILIRLILSSAMILTLVWLILNLQAWQHCSFSPKGRFSTCRGEALYGGSLIATYKARSNCWLPDIRLERMQIRIPWKHLFYTPKYYTARFFINPETTPANTELVLGGKDTLFSIGIHALVKLPEKITVYLYGTPDSLTYFLEEKFPENMSIIAPVPFWEKIDSGPYGKDD